MSAFHNAVTGDDSPDPDRAKGKRLASSQRHGRVGYGFYGRWTPLALGFLLIAALLAIGIYDQRREPAAAPPVRPLAPGSPAPAMTLTLMDGQQFSLADLRGTIVVLNFWASWCEPCRQEAPLLQEIAMAGEIAGRPVQVVGIGLKADNDADARAFVQEFGLTYPIGRDTGDTAGPFGPIQLAFHIPDRYPATVFIDEHGSIVAIHTGELTRPLLEAYISQIPT